MIFKNDKKNKKYFICPWNLTSSYNKWMNLSSSLPWIYLLGIKCLSRQSELEIKEINNERICQ